jgi:CRP-like cAMP-binding protein
VHPALPVRNRILAALLATEHKRLLPKLEHVALTRGQVIYRADQDIEEVYFPEEAVVAMVDVMDNGRTFEVGIIGREGVVGSGDRSGRVAPNAPRDCHMNTTEISIKDMNYE